MTGEQQSNIVATLHGLTDAKREKIAVDTSEGRPKFLVKYYSNETRDAIARVMKQERFKPYYPFAVTFIQLTPPDGKESQVQ